jgi:PadR family transcriptional regulator AphA
MQDLTPAAYALLGYLTVKPQSAFELTKLMRESGALDLWPRTDSTLYLEPPKLVERGFATVSVAHTGKRSRSVYTITPAGRLALVAWLGRPGFRSKAADDILLKVFYANLGTKAQLLEQLGFMREQVRGEYLAMVDALEQHATGTFPFAQPAHLTRLVTKHELASLDARARWLAEAEQDVTTWPDTSFSEEQEAVVAKWYWLALADTRDALARFDRTRPETDEDANEDAGSSRAPGRQSSG